MKDIGGVKWKNVGCARRVPFLGICVAILVQTGAPAYAQAAPEFRTLDSNGVDLANGDLIMDVEEGSIGQGSSELKLIRQNNSLAPSQWDAFNFVQNKSGSTTTIRIGLPDRTGDVFTLSGSTYVASKANGATLTGGGNSFTYTQPNGTQILFSDLGYGTDGVRTSFCGSEGTLTACNLLPVSVTMADRTVITLTHGVYSYPGVPQSGVPVTNYSARLWSVANIAGYQIRFVYASGGLNPNGSGSAPPPATWLTRNTARFLNTTVSPTTPQATVTYASPSTGVTNVTRPDGQTLVVTNTSIKLPGDTTPSFSVTSSAGEVTSATRDGVSSSYAVTNVGTTRTATITNALGGQRTVVFTPDGTGGGLRNPHSRTDENGNTTSFTYDGFRRLTRTTYPEGNYVNYSYDGRGNVTETRIVAKAGSGLADIVTTAGYAATCTNKLTCDKPLWTKDAKGNQTDYSYDAATGQLLTVTLPAAPGGVRPQTRYSYTAVGGVPKLTGISSCQTTASCTGTADEVRTSIGYDGNLMPATVTTSAGDGSLSATVSTTYDSVGNVLTVDGPLPGTGDMVRYRYDAARRRVGFVAPDPDGAGPRKPSAERVTYDVDGRVLKVERGTVNSSSDADWASFVAAEVSDVVYDANGRMAKRSLSAGGTVRAVEQTSYDTLGRLTCTALRMNPAVFASLPASACTTGTAGADGPDRITRASYDPGGRAIKIESAVGTAEAADAVRTGYTNNGAIDYVIDGESNRTEYSYDGFDRLVKNEYPSAIKGANAANAADYEQLSYDANGNVTSRRLRDGTSIAYGYDNLNRLASKDLPGSEPDTTYGYDLLGRALIVTQGAQALTFTHDALGRNLTQAGPLGTITYGYDTAGRRTSIVYPGGALAIDTDYDVVGNVMKIRENGATSGVGVLAAYVYDDLGRRTSVTYGNGSVQSFGFDTASRLSTLTNNLGGAATTHDLAQTFAYNPASQIQSVTRSNDAYAWQAHYNVDRSYTINGLNRIMNVGSTAFTYDGRGNLTSDGTNTFTYTSENLLKTGPSSATLGYDPLGRLYQTVGGGVTTRFLYDGADLIGEYNGSNAVQRRYVHGPGTDEPIVWYEGSAINNTTRRFLMADERGSVVSVTDSAGATININAYDEYGIPAPTNIGRFGYTGQTWLPEVGLWYYKARMYSPTLGRFLQTDPVGYEDGMNWYNYVKSDPVNFVDPLGLCTQMGDGNGGWLPPVNCPSTTTIALNVAFWLNYQLATVADVDGGGDGGGGPPCSTASPAQGFMPPAIVAEIGKTATKNPLISSAIARVAVPLAILSLSGDTPRRRFRHYGYASQAKLFANGLRPGSYATAATGTPMSGYEAQAAFALPHSSPPDAYYDVTVNLAVPVVGPSPVMPANGQPGGGMEFVFPNGTPPGSVGPPNPIPPC